MQEDKKYTNLDLLSISVGSALISISAAIIWHNTDIMTALSVLLIHICIRIVDQKQNF